MENDNISTVFYQLDTGTIIVVCAGVQDFSFFGGNTADKREIGVFRMDSEVAKSIDIFETKLIDGVLVKETIEGEYK